jgi:DNA-3-methyladenine glycosylase II
MAEAYGLGDPDASDARRLAGISNHWAPFRSWVALLLRTRREENAGPAARSHSVR